MYWLIDFEGYSYGYHDYIIKEICILSSDGKQCFNYFIRNPKNEPSIPNNKTILYQYNRLKLKWRFGDFSFNEALDDIFYKVGSANLCIKGSEKKQFLEKQGFITVHEIEGIPSFKVLNECMGEWCEIRHGKWCARRKVNELKRFIDNNSDVASQFSV